MSAEVRTEPEQGKIKVADKHYGVICISMYTDSLAALDEMVSELKQRNIRRVNRSSLIRYALEQVDLDKVPKQL